MYYSGFVITVVGIGFVFFGMRSQFRRNYTIGYLLIVVGAFLVIVNT